MTVGGRGDPPTGADDARENDGAVVDADAAAPSSSASAPHKLAYAREHAAELTALFADAVTAVLVVVVQDVAFKESITACAALQVVSFCCNWRAYTLKQRVIFPKAIEVAVPSICLALVAPAWLAEEATHKVVYLVICGAAAAVMLGTVLLEKRRSDGVQGQGRPCLSFAAEYLMDWTPREHWGTPLLRKLARELGWAWIASQLLMAAAAAVSGVVVGGGGLGAAVTTA